MHGREGKGEERERERERGCLPWPKRTHHGTTTLQHYTESTGLGGRRWCCVSPGDCARYTTVVTTGAPAFRAVGSLLVEQEERCGEGWGRGRETVVR